MSTHIDPAVWARARVAQDELQQIRRQFAEREIRWRDQRRREQQEEGVARQRHSDQEDPC